MRRPHVLLTAWGFSPARTSGVYRAVALADGFVRNGWDVTVLTAPRAFFVANGITDLSIEARLDSRIRIVGVPLAASSYENDLLDWSFARARYPEFWQSRRNHADLRAFPEAQFGGWSQALSQAAARVHREHRVDVAMGTANPYVDFVPGVFLHDRAGVPYVMDYRDAWTVDVFRGGDADAATDAQRAWERSAISNAHRVVFVNEPIREWHAARHPGSADRMQVLANGFDLPVDGSFGVPWRKADPSALVFGYVGTINYGQFPAASLFSGWRTARARDSRLANARLELHGYLGRTGVASPELAAQLNDACADGVTYEGPVAKADVSRVYARFDALALALASGPGVTSGKVYEFVGTGLPIVSIHERHSAAATVLDAYPAWAPAENLTADGVADAFVRGADLALSQTPAERDASIAFGSSWERSRLIDPWIANLAESLSIRTESL